MFWMTRDAAGDKIMGRGIASTWVPRRTVHGASSSGWPRSRERELAPRGLWGSRGWRGTGWTWSGGEGSRTTATRRWRSRLARLCQQWPRHWPCRHRHEDAVCIPELKTENQPRHLVPKRISNKFAEEDFSKFETCAIQKFHRTLLVKKKNQVLGLETKWD